MGFTPEIIKKMSIKPAGQLASGKHFYAPVNHPAHRSFTAQEHAEAATHLHNAAVKQWKTSHDNQDGFGTNHARNLMLAAKAHGLQAKKLGLPQKPEKLAASEKILLKATSIDDRIRRLIARKPDLLKKYPEWKKLIKSPYGPAGMGLYSQNDNARRKAGRTGQDLGFGPNRAVQSTKPTASQQAGALAAEAKAKSKKNPVKVYSQAEIKNLFRTGFKRPPKAV